MKEPQDSVESSINIKTKSKPAVLSSKSNKKHFGCVARGWSGEDCAATEWVEIFFWARLQTLENTIWLVYEHET